MNRRDFVRTGAAALAAVPALVRGQGVVVCGKCGREAKGGETTCSHCGAALAATRAPEPAPAPKPVSDRRADVLKGALSVAADSLKQARELETRQPEVALCYYQNALAVMRLLPAGTTGGDSVDAVLQGNVRTLQSLLHGRVPCRKCNGTGNYQWEGPKTGKSRAGRVESGVSCPACKGVGSFPGFRENSKSKMAVQQGRGEFERRQMVAGDVRVGRAFVPAALDALLTNRQRALVMTGMPVPCSACQLTGRQACTVCKGTGWVKCSYTGCQHGEVKVVDKSGRQAKRSDEGKVEMCPKCEGIGEVPCEACKGSGSVACKRCDGSGKAPECSRCKGTGFAPCTKCKGTGEVKGEVCTECKGETVVLCSNCRGEGAVAR